MCTPSWKRAADRGAVRAAGRGAGRLRGAACWPWVSGSSFHSADTAKCTGALVPCFIPRHGASVCHLARARNTKARTAGNSKGARQVSFWCLVWLPVVRGPVPTERWGLPSPLPQCWRVITFSPIPRSDVREPLLPDLSANGCS